MDLPAITLKTPVTHAGVTYDKLTIDPTMGALEAFEDAIAAGTSEAKALIVMLADAAKVPVEVIRQLRSSDLAGARSFIEGGGPLGGSPAPTGGAGEPAAPKSPTS